MIITSFNSYLLTVARESRGKSQSELSEQIKIDQGYLSRLEKGIVVNPTKEILLKISAALKYPLEFFYQSENHSLMSDFFYRKRIAISAKEKNKLEARIQIIGMIIDRLSKSVEIPSFDIPSIPVSGNFSPSDIARLTREFFKIGRGPIKELITKLERQGITVIQISVDSQKFDAVTVFTNGNNPVIVMNKTMPNDRKRHTLAHELGHLVMHLPFRFDLEIYERIKSNMDALEKEANDFASEFLVPANECRNDMTLLTYQKLATLKMYWQVSKSSLVYKAKKIGAIDESRYKFLMIELSRRGERVNEIGEVEIDSPKMLSEMVNVHLTHLGYTWETLTQILSVYQFDIQEVMNESGKLYRVAI